jgi:hypothetical protein
VAKELQALRNKAVNPTKLLPPSGNQAPQTKKEHIPIPQEDGVTKTYADAAKTLPTHMQPKSTPDNQPTGTRPPIRHTDKDIHLQLQLILAKLEQQAQVHTALSKRIDRLERATPPRES